MLPQNIYDDITELTGENPFGQIVMVYPGRADNDGQQGLLPVTYLGMMILESYFAKCGIRADSRLPGCTKSEDGWHVRDNQGYCHNCGEYFHEGM